MLKSPYRAIGLRSKDAVDLDPLVRVARLVAELEFFLHTAYRVTAAALFDLDD